MSRRTYLPIVDRRLILRGAAASLAASLVGCRTDIDEPGAGGHDGVDAGMQPASPGFERCGDSLCLRLAEPANAALRTVDGARVIDFEGTKLLVIRASEASFVVLSAICTHQGCVVSYAAPAGDVRCPCHGSRFALDGSVTRGPADRPLAQLAASYDATTDVVTITLT